MGPLAADPHRRSLRGPPPPGCPRVCSIALLPLLPLQLHRRPVSCVPGGALRANRPVCGNPVPGHVEGDSHVIQHSPVSRLRPVLPDPVPWDPPVPRVPFPGRAAGTRSGSGRQSVLEAIPALTALSPRPAPRTLASCTRPCTTESWPCAAVWSRSRRPRPPRLSLEPLPTRTTATTTCWPPREPLEPVSGWRCPEGPGWPNGQLVAVTTCCVPTGASEEGDGQAPGST